MPHFYLAALEKKKIVEGCENPVSTASNKQRRVYDVSS